MEKEKTIHEQTFDIKDYNRHLRKRPVLDFDVKDRTPRHKTGVPREMLEELEKEILSKE